MDHLSEQWKSARNSMEPPLQTAEQLIAKAREKKNSILYFHYGNIVILTLTLIGISLFFYFIAPFKEWLSKIGVGLMIGGLFIRIMIEIFSTLKSKNIQLVNDISKTTSNALAFYNFRKKVHGPVTIIVVALYVTGFYFLSPEFNKYIALKWMLLMHGSFLLGAVFLIWQIRKGIQKEINNLSSLVELKKEVNKT